VCGSLIQVFQSTLFLPEGDIPLFAYYSSTLFEVIASILDAHEQSSRS
jgi:hypothetical protein